MKYTLTPLAFAVASTFVSAAANADVIISEYIEGSSNNKAVELYNTSSDAVDLSEYQLAVYANGKTTSSYVFKFEGTLASGKTYVVAHQSASAEILAAAQQTTGAGLFNGDDALVLTRGEAVVDSLGKLGQDPGSSWSNNGVSTKDMTLRRIEGSPARTDASSDFDPSQYFTAFAKNDASDLGKYAGGDNGDGGTDGDNGGNPTDPIELVCHDPATNISSIQGAGAASPLVGQVVTVEAVVSADFQADDQLKGFFLSSLNPDNDPQTSEGIFVYYSKDDVAVGDIVRLQGKVAEYYNATQIGDVSALSICGTASVSPTDITLPVSTADELEAYEGMLVNVPQSLFVTDTGSLARYGEVTLASERLYQGTQVAAPGDAANAVEAQNRLKELLLDDGSTQKNPAVIPYPAPQLDAYNSLRLGDTVENLTGVLGYSFNRYRLHPTQTPQFIHTNPRTDAPTLEKQGDFKVASFNVLNYFNGDGQGGGFPTARGADNQDEFLRQQAKLVSAISALDADAIGLMEIENDGFGEFSALQSLVNALNDATTEGTYAFVNFNVDQVGTDAITTAIIYRSDKLVEAGQAAINAEGALSYGNRAAIAQSFKHIASEEAFTLAVAHLKSKGGCKKAEGANQDQNDGQACHNATRVAGATEFANWLATSPTGVEDEDIILVGDINAYAKEDPITAFANAGLTNVIPALEGDTLGYSYQFRGRLGSLDHALASASLLDKVVAATDWHINADEPAILDYNTEYKSQTQQASLYADDAYRASDHDPVIVAIKAEKIIPEPEVIEGEINNVKGWFWPQRFSVELPEGFDTLEVSLSSGWGDANLKVRHQNRPTIFSYDCRSASWGNNESCSFTNPQQGTWHISVQGFLPYGEVKLHYRAVKTFD